MKQRQKLVTFLGQLFAHMQWLRIYIWHMIRMATIGHRSWSHFWGNFWLTCSWLRVIHVAEDSDRHEAERKVGHIFGASFGSHAMVAYIHCAHDTYGKHSAEKLVTFLGQILDHMHVLYMFMLHMN